LGVACHQQRSIEVWLLASKMGISLSNADPSTPLNTWHAGRAVAITSSGRSRMQKATWAWDQYQSRGWLAWHHHVALVAMAHLFVM
jgi:SRSO17 transposase